MRPVPDELVSREQMAQILGCSVDLVDDLRAQGMPWFRLGRRLVRFRRGEAQRWVEREYGGIG